MKNGTLSYIEDCKKLNLPFFMDAAPDRIPKVHPSVAGFFDTESDEDEDITDQEDETAQEDDGFGNIDSDMKINTRLGKMHLKTAEAIYFNGGRMTFGAKSRHSRFYQSNFRECSAMDSYNSGEKCCDSGIVEIGHFGNFMTFDQKKIQSVKGRLCFLSKTFDPIKFFCPVHNVNTSVNAWVWVKKTNRYVRCVL